jgi:hypothetical protein
LLLLFPLLLVVALRAARLLRHLVSSVPVSVCWLWWHWLTGK